MKYEGQLYVCVNLASTVLGQAFPTSASQVLRLRVELLPVLLLDAVVKRD